MPGDTLATDDAVERIGLALYGTDWIGELSKRERWLIKRYIEGSSTGRAASILPTSIHWEIAGRLWAEVPGDPALMAEADRARDRRDWMEEQYDVALGWLEARSFDSDSDLVDKDAFEGAFAACFAAPAKPIRVVSPPPQLSKGEHLTADDTHPIGLASGRHIPDRHRGDGMSDEENRRFEPPPMSTTARKIDEFDLVLGWIPVTASLEIIKAVAGDLAWEQVKKAIRLNALPARCQADGVSHILEPYWLHFLAWDRPDGDVLWFDREKAWRRAGRPIDRAGVRVPDRDDNVVVSLAHCANLWADCAWPKATAVEVVDHGAPRATGLGRKPDARPPSREKAFWPAARVPAFDWLIENGCPESGDGNQAALERYVTKWLEDHNYEASESAVRRHVVRWIKERRAELNT